MATTFEAEIQALLVEMRDPEKVAKELRRRWKLKLLSEEEQRDVAEFYVAAGLYKNLFTQIEKLIAKKARLPWAAFVDGIGRAKVKPSEEDIEALFKGATAQNALDELVLSHQLDIWSRKFNEARTEIARQRLAQLEERKGDLKDKLKFFQANRMTGQEKEVMDQFEAISPADPELKRERESYDMRWARDVLSRRAPMEDASVEELSRRADRLTPEQEASKKLMVASAKDFATKDPSKAYDLALNLHFMDFNIEALEILKKAPASASVDWLRLELMIFARRYVDALGEATALEARYATDPEAAFAITYARARALKGLGQTELATDLLRSLVRVRPSYKSAQSLLMDWSGGDE